MMLLSAGADVGAGFVILGIGATAYLVPAIVALCRNHRNVGAICVLNLLLGWTLLGWIGALVWACTAQDERSAYPHG